MKCKTRSKFTFAQNLRQLRFVVWIRHVKVQTKPWHSDSHLDFHHIRAVSGFSLGSGVSDPWGWGANTFPVLRRVTAWLYLQLHLWVQCLGQKSLKVFHFLPSCECCVCIRTSYCWNFPVHFLCAKPWILMQSVSAPYFVGLMWDWAAPMDLWVDDFEVFWRTGTSTSTSQTHRPKCQCGPNKICGI